MYIVDHNDIFDHMYFTEPRNLSNSLNCMLKYQYFTSTLIAYNRAL